MGIQEKRFYYFEMERQSLYVFIRAFLPRQFLWFVPELKIPNPLPPNITLFELVLSNSPIKIRNDLV